MAISRTNINANSDGAQAAGRDIVTTNNTVVSMGTIIFDPQNLADIINALYSNKSNEAEPIDDFLRPTILEKNTLNNISDEYFKNCIEEDYSEFGAFDKFFKDPCNNAYKEKYRHILKEIKSKIIARQNAGENMEQILSTLFDYAKTETNLSLFNHNSHLADVLANYMYVNCDIGRKTE